MPHPHHTHANRVTGGRSCSRGFHSSPGRFRPPAHSRTSAIDQGLTCALASAHRPGALSRNRTIELCVLKLCWSDGGNYAQSAFRGSFVVPSSPMRLVCLHRLRQSSNQSKGRECRVEQLGQVARRGNRQGRDHTLGSDAS